MVTTGQHVTAHCISTGIRYAQKILSNSRYVPVHCFMSKSLVTELNNDVLISPGPLPKTVVDFWRMVWQERAPSIVMITNLKEGGKPKCQQYWPDSGTESFGPFQVTTSEQQVLADYTIRKLTVKVCETKESP